jgi:general stress protein 13
MQERIEVGTIIKGKVTSVKPYGAFVGIDEAHTGLVHISQIAHGYVKDINDYLKVGDEVEVKVISIDEATGKISLSIKETKPEQEKAEVNVPRRRNESKTANESTELFNNALEEKLKAWLKQSSEIQGQLNKRNNK